MAKKDKSPAVPNKHWEMRYSQWDPSRTMVVTQGADFVAKSPSERKTTHVKINREDH